MKIHPAGSITFVISENHFTSEEISDELAYVLANDFVEYFKYLLTKRGLDEAIVVTETEYYKGCVTVVISIGLVAAAGGGWVLVEFLKNYKEVREGLDKLIHDLKNINVWVKGTLFRKQSQPEKRIPEKTSKDREVLQVVFQHILNEFETIDPNYQKYWSSGQEITLTDDNGNACKLTIAVKREDLTFPDEKTIVQKEKKIEK